jgi:hypothetical protein
MPERVRERSQSHHDVFISYAQEDKILADAVCAKLEAHTIRCWIAPRDIPPGKHFPEAIIEGIEGGTVVVVIFSSHANRSPHVMRELTNAVNKGRIIIPFRIEDVEPSKSMEYLISIPHWLDAVTPPLEHHIDILIQTIDCILGTDKTPAACLAQAVTIKDDIPAAPLSSPAPEPRATEQSRPGALPAAQVPPVSPPFRPSKNLIAAGILLLVLLIALLGYSSGLFSLPAPPDRVAAEDNITWTIPPGISEVDYYRSSEARVDTVVLTVVPTQTMTKDTGLYIDVSKDSSKAVITVQFNGGPGMGLVKDNRVVLTRSDGTVSEGRLDLRERLSTVQLQGSRGTDRLQVIIVLHSGEERNVIDTLLPYRQYR